MASVLHRSGVTSSRIRRFAGDGVPILMYHRVLPKAATSAAVQAGMVVEPETLDLHLRYLGAYFEIVPLSALVSDPDSSIGARGGKPSCVITFDDGWRDFLEHAFPVLKAHAAPATVFLPTDFVGTDRWFWTDRVGFLLERLARSRDGGKRTSFGKAQLVREVMELAGSHETILENAIELLKPHRAEKIEQVLSELAAVVGEDAASAGRAFLSWEEIRELSASGLVSFGSHSAGHHLLTGLTEQEARHELMKSMDELIARKAASADFVAFSYPNGNFSRRLSEIVREAGYHLAVTTQRGWHRRGANLYTINRIGVHQDTTSTEAMFASRISNLL